MVSGGVGGRESGRRHGRPLRFRHRRHDVDGDLAEKAGGRLWFQLHVRADRDLTRQMLDRARAAGFEGLMVTVDTPVPPNRQFNERNGFSPPFRVTPRSVADVALHPSWFLRVLMRYVATNGMPRCENYPEAYRTDNGAA
jgi:isopentenyl diphosphate isomerase/L-lactate dehydrogenase-like FMN-dependent dehydrogenase